MKILLINHYAGSPQLGMEYRPFYMASNWRKMGHDVTIVASSYSHLRSKNPELKQQILSEIIEGIQYVWLNTPRYDGNGAKRAINIFSFVFQLFRYAKVLVRESGNKLDCVIASSTYPLDILAAWYIAKIAKARLVYEVHDLWPLSPIELGGMHRWHPFIVVMQFAEDFACRNADAVISMLPKADDHLRGHGMAQSKFFYIPNGVLLDDWQTNDCLVVEHEKVLHNLQAQGKFLVGYAGAHGVANALDSIIEAAKALRTTNIVFVLIGQGPEKASLEKKALDAQLDNVLFLPSVAKTHIPQLLENFDALYIGLQKQPLFRFGISPNKLMDYMMAGKPIIQAIEAGNDLVAESGCGFSIPAEDPERLVCALHKLVAMDTASRKAMGNKGKEYIIANHDYAVLSRKFLETIKSLK